LDDEDEDWQQANFGARLASSWTKQRLAVLCHTALASAAAIILSSPHIAKRYESN
jgi:hypothetical protein